MRGGLARHEVPPSPANAPSHPRSATMATKGIEGSQRSCVLALPAAHTTRVRLVMGTTVPPVERPAPLSGQHPRGLSLPDDAHRADERAEQFTVMAPRKCLIANGCHAFMGGFTHQRVTVSLGGPT